MRVSVHAFALAPECPLHFALGVFLGQSVALVAFASALGKRKLNLYAAFFEVKAERHQAESLLGDACRQLGDLV